MCLLQQIEQLARRVQKKKTKKFKLKPKRNVLQCTLYLHWNVHLGFLKILSIAPNLFQTLPVQLYHPPPLYDKIIDSSETFPRLYGTCSATASLAAATCNDDTVYHLSEVLSTAMQLHHRIAVQLSPNSNYVGADRLGWATDFDQRMV